MTLRSMIAHWLEPHTIAEGIAVALFLACVITWAWIGSGAA